MKNNKTETVSRDKQICLHAYPALAAGQRGRHQMRHHHTRRGASEGVQAEEDVEESQRNHPEHPEWHCFQRAHRGGQCASSSAWLEEAHCGWQVTLTETEG